MENLNLKDNSVSLGHSNNSFSFNIKQGLLLEFFKEFRKLIADIANLSFLLRSFTLDHPSSTAYLDFIFDSCQSLFRLQKRLAVSLEIVDQDEK